MIRKLMASSAMLALMTAGAFSVAQAQTEPAEETPPAAIEQEATTPDAGAATEATTEATPTEAALVPEEPTIATAFIGQNVYSSEDPESDNIGEVKDLVIGQDGMITEAIVGVGGFLGIGEKNVAVPFDELEVFERDGEIRLVYAATREQLEAAPEVDWTAYDPDARFAEEQAAMQPEVPAGDLGGGGLAPVPAPADDLAATDVAPEEEPEAAGANVEAPETQGTEAQGMTAETEAPAEEEMAAADPATPAEEEIAADTAAPAEEEMAADTAAPAEDEIAAAGTEAQPDDQMAQTEPEVQTGEQMAQTDVGATPGGEPEFLSFSADQVRASTLMGKEVFGPDDESIGEVSDLILQDDGETRAALIDVGGFLGVGEKAVAIPFEQIEVAPAADEGGEPRLTVAMSREELEQLPTFEDRTMGSEDVAATEGTAEPAAQEDITAETTEPATEPATEEPAVAETEQPEAMPEEDIVAEGETAPAEGIVAGEEARQLATQDLSAEELLGTPVYGTGDETIGEVGDVIFAESGDIEAVVIDVGGFLGIGEKTVAVQFDALNVQKDTSGDTTLWLNATQEQLENAPTYEEAEAVQ